MQLTNLADSVQELEQKLLQFSNDSVQNMSTGWITTTLYFQNNQICCDVKFADINNVLLIYRWKPQHTRAYVNYWILPKCGVQKKNAKPTVDGSLNPQEGG